MMLWEGNLLPPDLVFKIKRGELRDLGEKDEKSRVDLIAYGGGKRTKSPKNIWM